MITTLMVLTYNGAPYTIIGGFSFPYLPGENPLADRQLRYINSKGLKTKLGPIHISLTRRKLDLFNSHIIIIRTRAKIYLFNRFPFKNANFFLIERHFLVFSVFLDFFNFYFFFVFLIIKTRLFTCIPSPHLEIALSLMQERKYD
ncbi:hypothetical protein HanIR_Chr08g0375641 [Helianthus annuus]|nr:hypothetical protein HanIR_Chr08g0375641 [Helianthus annuus]